MSEKFLNGANVVAVLKQVRGKRTAQNQAFFALLFLYRGCPANYFAENRRRFQSEKTGTFAGRFYAAGSRGDYMPLVGHTFYGGELAIRFGFAAG